VRWCDRRLCHLRARDTVVKSSYALTAEMAPLDLARTRTSRSSATGSIDNSPDGFLLH
jgi:hypothetical protein